MKSTVFLFAVTFGITISFVLFNQQNPSPTKPDPMARSFLLWLHGLGDSGPANEPIKTLFTSPQFSKTNWSFPSAPSNPVTCNCMFYSHLGLFVLCLLTFLADVCPVCILQFIRCCRCTDGAVMPSWFDIAEIPVTADSPKDEGSVLKAVQNIHAMIDKEIASGINPSNVFVCGFSQGGALTLASVLLYPKTLGGGAVFSGWVPFNSSILERVTPEAKKTPILWSHGMADRTVLFEAGQAGPPLLEKAGVSCEFKAYPGLGHSINTEELKSLESWIKSHLQSSS